MADELRNSRGLPSGNKDQTTLAPGTRSIERTLPQCFHYIEGV